MITNKEVRYTDMSEKELIFIVDALKYRVAEAEAETKRLRGKLARFKVMQYAGEVVQHAST